MNIQDWIQNYRTEQIKLLEALPVQQAGLLIGYVAEAIRNDRSIFVAGNGGSASNASHFFTDMVKSASQNLGKAVRCVSLNESMSLITATGNDYSFEEIFSMQLQHMARPDDLLLVLSVSGNSENLVRTVKRANDLGLETIAIVGGYSGRLSDLARHVLVIDSKHYGRVEDVQMIVSHMIAYAFIENPDMINNTK